MTRARIDMAVSKAAEFLIKTGVEELPVNPISLARGEGITLFTYGELADRISAAIGDICDMYGSRDAFTMYSGDRSRCAIVYNETIESVPRVMWSVCHELGHCELGHFDEFDISALDAETLRALDIEADTWAANVIAPVSVIDLLDRPLHDGHGEMFGLSRQGWQVRRRCLTRDRRYIPAELAETLAERFSRFVFSRVCDACGTFFADREQSTCPVCGENGARWLCEREAKSENAQKDDFGSRGTLCTRDDGRPRVCGMLENPMVVDEFWI